MPSRAKYLLHKLFGAFHDTPCIDFEYANSADVDVGCGAILMGKYWYFGGEIRKKNVR